MKSIGIVRKVDELGRYTLPIELRRELHIGTETMVELYRQDEYVVISNIENRMALHKDIDKLGRVVIPIELRRALGIVSGETSLQVFVDENKIYLKKYAVGCVFCGEMNYLKKYMDKAVCTNCLEKLGEFI